MLRIKSLTIKNFLSIGAVTQSINFENRDLVLVLGENLDLGGNDNRNGVGKSAMVNALSYALFGSALTNIKKNNLINKTNGKGMMVTLDFEINDTQYRIERGRAPAKFHFYVNGTELESEATDEAQGDNRITQAELERVIGLSHTMFKNIVALNTYNEPFLSMRASDQREIIEHLLGITKLSEKAELLKKQIKDTKDSIKEEEFRIKAIQETNSRIESNIKSLRVKSSAWIRQNEKAVSEIKEAIEVLSHIDSEVEIANHKILEKIKQDEAESKRLNKELGDYQKRLQSYQKQLEELETDASKTEERLCPTCGHDLDDHSHEAVTKKVTSEIEEQNTKISEMKGKIEYVQSQLEKIEVHDKQPETFYDRIEEAYNHKNSLDTLENDLRREENSVNPHLEQIEELEKSGLQEVSYDKINELSAHRDHQEFLLRLLTNKDSFIRKKIIDQNLAYLNARLKHYITILGLPHDVVFQSDLSVEITEHGRDLDFDNLSRGERTRLILSLSLSFRDVYESLNTPMNLLFIDELIDNGLDTAGVESSLGVLKKICRDSKKNIYLISHRDELVGRVDNVMRVVKSGGFTTFEEESDIM